MVLAVGALRSLCYQQIASDFIESALTCASWMSLHSVHRRVRCSNPDRAEAICCTSMHDWHLGQRGHIATRGDKAGLCGPGIGASRRIRRERYRTLCHRCMPERCGDRSSMPTRHYSPLINIAHIQKYRMRPAPVCFPAFAEPWSWQGVGSRVSHS